MVNYFCGISLRLPSGIKANTPFPTSFLSTYDVREKAIVTPESWMEWVM